MVRHATYFFVQYESSNMSSFVNLSPLEYTVIVFALVQLT